MMQTRAARASQPIAAASHARAQRHARYAEQRAHGLEDYISYSDSDSALGFGESEEDLSEGEVNDAFISDAAARIARCNFLNCDFSAKTSRHPLAAFELGRQQAS